MATLNHAKDNRLGVWRPKQYETNGLRGRILVFRFLEPQSTTAPLFSPSYNPHVPAPLVVPSATRSAALARALGVIFLSHIPSCAFITFKRDRRSRWCGHSPLLLRPFFFSIPFFLILFSSFSLSFARALSLFPFFPPSCFFVTERRMQKREDSSRASLETGSPAAPPRAITLPHGISPFVRWWRWWLVPLCPTVPRCPDTPPLLLPPLVESQ